MGEHTRWKRPSWEPKHGGAVKCRAWGAPGPLVSSGAHVPFPAPHRYAAHSGLGPPGRGGSGSPPCSLIPIAPHSEKEGGPAVCRLGGFPERAKTVLGRVPRLVIWACSSSQSPAQENRSSAVCFNYQQLFSHQVLPVCSSSSYTPRWSSRRTWAALTLACLSLPHSLHSGTHPCALALLPWQ